jgi:hypothetical protein
MNRDRVGNAATNKWKLIGKRPSEVFPSVLGASYAQQDETVLHIGKRVEH